MSCSTEADGQHFAVGVCVWGGVIFLNWQQTGSRQPQGASSVTGAQEGRAQLDVMPPQLHHAAAVILLSVYVA